jgi:hypothetical protein
LTASDDGVQVGYARLGLTPGVKATVDFLAQSATGVDQDPAVTYFVGSFKSIDTIGFESASGQLFMDDLVLKNFVSGGEAGEDNIDIPGSRNDSDFEGRAASLVAQATSNGYGGTIINHDQGALTLEGISLSAVSTDWFI